MAIGSAATGVAGPVEVNAAQSAANAGNVPQVVLDDPTNGSVVVHIGGGGKTTPTIAVVIAGAGTAGTAALSATSDDVSGQITLVTGSAAWGAGAQCTVTFGTPHLIKTNVALGLVTAADEGAAQIPAVFPYVTRTLAGFSIDFQTADTAAHTYIFDYIAAGT